MLVLLFSVKFLETNLRTPLEHSQADSVDKQEQDQPEPSKHVFFYEGFYCTEEKSSFA